MLLRSILISFFFLFVEERMQDRSRRCGFHFSLYIAIITTNMSHKYVAGVWTQVFRVTLYALNPRVEGDKKNAAMPRGLRRWSTFPHTESERNRGWCGPVEAPHHVSPDSSCAVWHWLASYRCCQVLAVHSTRTMTVWTSMMLHTQCMAHCSWILASLFEQSSVHFIDLESWMKQP